jgi:hypothetical protein
MVVFAPQSTERLTGVGSEACRLNAGDGTGFVVVRGIPADANRTYDLSLSVADQNPSRHGDQTAAGCPDQGTDEMRPFKCTFLQRSGRNTHTHRTPGLAYGDVGAKRSTWAILTLEHLQVSAIIEHRYGDRP